MAMGFGTLSVFWVVLSGPDLGCMVSVPILFEWRSYQPGSIKKVPVVLISLNDCRIVMPHFVFYVGGAGILFYVGGAGFCLAKWVLVM